MALKNANAAGPERLQTLSISRAALIGSVIVVAIAATCVRLGFWQLSRMRQRDAHNELLLQRMNQPAIPLDLTASADTNGLLFRRVQVSGAFDHDRSIVLPGRSLRGAPGVHLLTPVLLHGGARAVLVNRGWYPAADGVTIPFDSVRTPASAELVGLVVPFPGSTTRRKPTRAEDTSSTFRRAWFAPDPAALKRQFPYTLLNLEVQALPDSSAAQFPVRLQPPVLDRGPHLGYAVQWFSFAAIAIIGWIALMIRKGEVRRPS